MTIFKRHQIGEILVTLLSVVLFAYVMVRANELSFTYDESSSFRILRGDVLKMFTANHHYLNTYLMGACDKLFGDSELSLRLPNVLSFLLYCLGSFIILRKGSLLETATGVSLLLLNPFLLDFFSLARGYGLSIGFMMVSLSFFLTNRTKMSDLQFITNFIWCTFFCSWALLSNLTLINYFIAVGLVYCVEFLIRLQKKGSASIAIQRLFIACMLSATIPLFFAMARLLLLKTGDQLYFGASTLFNSLNSVVSDSLYINAYPGWLGNLIKYLVLILMIFSALLIYLRKVVNFQFFKIGVLLAIVILGLILEHYIFGTKYPKGRTALYLVPLFGTLFYSLFKDLYQTLIHRKLSVIAYSVGIVIPLVFLFHFISSSNLKYTKTWWFDANTKNLVEIVDKYAVSKTDSLTLATNWRFGSTVKYYIKTTGARIRQVDLPTLDSLKVDLVYDFKAGYDQSEAIVIVEYEDTNSVLFKPNPKSESHPLYSE